MMKKHTGGAANAIGAVETKVVVRNISQSQSGLLNKQKISTGSID